MRKYKQVETVEKRQVLTSITCDICGKLHVAPWCDTDWREGNYSVDDVEISYRTGTSYPEGGSGKKYTFEICPQCFVEFLVPFINTFGNAKKEHYLKDWGN